jgi:hypothetical protein
MTLAAAAALHLQGISLLVPMPEVYTLESALDLDRERRSDRSVGALRVGDSWLAVFCLSDRLEPLAVLATECRVCAVLTSDAGAIGIACRGVETLAQGGLTEVQMPACMRTEGSPILGLTWVRGADDAIDRVYCRTSAAGLLRFLEPVA